MQTRIAIWLHKPTNTRHYIAGSNGAAFLMQALRSHRMATEAELNDASQWSKV
ncbi:hypothetical protein [Stutzerimonas stutzeri]|uniref:hypothetical protein n=1 Tax=Stutzerimonas stutzeri TaxID=316 RepID=UPI0013FE459F|nr:hypothetical protein [Stutzerimonas stutzeri]|tara:strand:+ start:21 stop:179 length:159 start_codon:yes stop_codon:yes gene_type:complete